MTFIEERVRFAEGREDGGMLKIYRLLWQMCPERKLVLLELENLKASK